MAPVEKGDTGKSHLFAYQLKAPANGAKRGPELGSHCCREASTLGGATMRLFARHRALRYNCSSFMNHPGRFQRPPSV